MSVCAGIQDDAIIGKSDLMQFIYHETFYVALVIGYLNFRIILSQLFQKMLEIIVAIYFGFTNPQQIEVRAIDNLNFHFQ